MVRQPATRLQVSGHRFLCRRVEYALLGGDIRVVQDSFRAPWRSLVGGCIIASVVLAGSVILAVLRPQQSVGSAPIVMGQQTGALYVSVGGTLHPVLNLASARLITATNINPKPVRESELGRAKRGPLLGIAGAPQVLERPLTGDESAWTVCDTATDGRLTTTVIAGSLRPDTDFRSLGPEQTVLVTPGDGAATYLLYAGQRATVNLADPAVVRALRLEGLTPRTVSRLVLSAIPEAPPITAPRIPVAGSRGPLPGFPVGSVIRLARVDNDEYYVVLADGVQRVGQVAADLIRLTDSQGTREVIALAPDVIRAIPTVRALPVFTFPERISKPVLSAADALCAIWTPATAGRAATSFLTGANLPLPAGQSPVNLAQADGNGPALDAVYLPPGRSVYARPAGLSGDNLRPATRYLVTDTGVRFAVHDDDAARSLGLPATAIPAPWPLLALLPSGPELSRQSASVACDTVLSGRSGVPANPQPP